MEGFGGWGACRGRGGVEQPQPEALLYGAQDGVGGAWERGRGRVTSLKTSTPFPFSGMDQRQQLPQVGLDGVAVSKHGGGGGRGQCCRKESPKHVKVGYGSAAPALASHARMPSYDSSADGSRAGAGGCLAWAHVTS